MSRTYNIIMITLMGKKYGRLMLCENGDQVTGILDILGHQNMISGTLSPEGQCSFSGELVTPIRNIAFLAEGRASASGINLVLRTNKNVMPVSGEIEKESIEGR